MVDAWATTAVDRNQSRTRMQVLAMLVPISRRFCRTTCTAFALSLLVVMTSCVGADGFAVGGGGAVPSFAPVVQDVIPAVVNVSAVQRVSRAELDEGELSAAPAKGEVALRKVPQPMLDELLRRYLSQRGRRGMTGPKVTSVALGSGFIIDPNGYVVTDDHVVDNAEKVTVIVQDATEYSARIVGRDPMTDLALLKIDAAQPFSYVHWGDSDSARVGDWVLAIGNPFGLDSTVSSGIISGRGRDIHSGPYDDYLQIDAAMNRGNSGGPTSTCTAT